MGTKKLTDKQKIDKVKPLLLAALKKRKQDGQGAETLGFVVGAICNAYAILDADKEDFQAVNFVSTQLWMEVTGIQSKEIIPQDATQMQLGQSIGVIDEQTSSNVTKKSGK